MLVTFSKSSQMFDWVPNHKIEDMNVLNITVYYYCKLCTLCSSVITTEIQRAFEWWINLRKVLFNETIFEEIQKLLGDSS